MKLSVIMPVYNEIGTIAEIIRRVLHAPVGLAKEVIIVDDCSTDGTREYLHDLVKSSGLGLEGAPLKVFFHEQNRGKGAGIQTGIVQATGTIIVIQDADLEYDPEDYPTWCSAIGSTAVHTASSISGICWGIEC
jgi:glycosyltransferase involved in cell wall biosynthesis